MLRAYAMLEKFLRLARGRVVPGYSPQHVPAKFDNVVIAMSGGVDSSVAAALFAHYPKATGVYMQNWSESQALESIAEEPCYEKDWKDVAKLGDFLGVPVEKVNFESDYWIDVFEPMLQEYDQGRTPNPDIGCNKFVKFGKLKSYLDQKYGHDNYHLVTGHYSRVLQHLESKEYHLLRGYYPQKDQSYYLSQINGGILPRLVLPMGHLTKPEVRDMARELQLPTANKRDSQGICFVNNSQHKKFNKFLEHYLTNKPGNVITVEPTGEKTVWGTHKGLWSYTLGQKIGDGISLPQADPRYTGAWYVSEKIPATNEIVIVRGRENPQLYRDKLRIQDFEYLGEPQTIRKAITEALQRGELRARYRSLMEPEPLISINTDADEFHLQFQRPQRAMAPGQFCCLLSQNRILGSGPIM